MTKPFLKWAGGKTALLPEILARLPEKIQVYSEPFLGGGAVFFALAEARRFKLAYLSDSNRELILAYRLLATRRLQTINALKKHVYEEGHYYKVRAQHPPKLDGAARAARFIYLNRVCFNGLYRVNRKGEFNVPFGRYTNPTICDAPTLTCASELLRGGEVKVSAFDFEYATEPLGRDDAVYFDPPYVPVSATSNFTAYSKGGFGLEEQKRLADVARRLDARGVHVLLSNSDTPLVRKLYKGFKIEKVRAPRRINSKGGKRGDVGELLISGKKQ